MLGIGTLGFVLGADTSVWTVIPFLFVYGVGVGFATAQLTGVILTDVPVESSGQGSGIQSTFRQVGSALGIAILGTILISTLGSGVRDRLSTVPGLPAASREAIAAAVKSSGGSAIVALREHPGNERVVAASSQALASSAGTVAFTAAGFVLFGLLVTVGLPNPRGGAGGPEGDPAGEEPRGAPLQTGAPT